MFFNTYQTIIHLPRPQLKRPCASPGNRTWKQKNSGLLDIAGAADRGMLGGGRRLLTGSRREEVPVEWLQSCACQLWSHWLPLGSWPLFLWWTCYKMYFAVCSYLVKLFLPISGCRDFIEGTKKRHFCPSLNQGVKGMELGFMIVGVIEILREKINFCRLWG